MKTSKPKSSSAPRKMMETNGSPVAMTTTTGATGSMTEHQHMEARERKERQMRRWTTDMDDLRAKLEREKAEALNQQKEAMNRAFRVQLTKMMKEKDELVRKCQLQQQQASHKILPAAASSSELQKLVQENNLLRSEKKKQEEQLQVFKESEQYRFENMRSLLDDKARELTLLQKQLRQQIARLREESRAKDRVISHLEAELRMQSGRAQQFRDILEQNLLSCRTPVNGQNAPEQELIARERKLLIQVEDLQEAMRQQQETFAHEKRELLRRLSETEKQQTPIKQKSKHYLSRNVQLSVKNQELTQALKTMQQQLPPGASQDDTNLKRSLTRPNVNQLGTPSKNDKQRRMEYVQQIQKLRKEQRYYSMWELPPLLEVETDSAGDATGSEGSLSPAATSGVTSCSSDSAWSEDTRRELEVLFSQLSREHSELQRNYQMLHEKLRQLTCFSDADAANVNYATLQADYSAARARIRDLEEIVQLKNSREGQSQQQSVVPSLLEIQAKFVREKHNLQTQMAMLNHRLMEAKSKHQAVQSELNEVRDQNELLEFRILELEECQERVFVDQQAVSQCSTDQRDRKDVCTDTDSDDISVGDSGITSLTSLVVECPSPTLPSSSGISPDSDYLGEKISAVKAEIQLMVSSLNDTRHKTILAQLQALLGVCQSRLAHKNISNAAETSNWDWQLQESGIFEDDHHSSTVDTTTQTEESVSVQHPDVSVRVTVPLPLSGLVMEQVQKETDDKAVQAVVDFQDFATQAEQVIKTVCHDKIVQASSSLELPEVIEGCSQTEEPVMTLADFRDIEMYYVEQIELLQKEKASHRKKFQTSRDEVAQTAQQLELLGRQFQERERQFEEILQKNCRAFERELESARNLNSNELSTLKECLQLVWHEVKDYVGDDMPKTSVMEFTQALISSLHGICAELGQLRIKVADLEEMEQAFQTTLQQADGLVHHIEEKHLQRIRELELNELELKHQLEEHQAGRHPAEETDGSLEIKIQELEQENDALSAQVGKCQELENYCHQLHGRLEEYEQREKGFQQAVQEAERRFSAREQRYREEVELLRSELDKCRESETCWRQRLEQREGQLGVMRSELEVEQKTIASLEAEVKDLQSKLEKDDTSFRNEVTKLRSQLNISLMQLNELESLNCQLREQILEHQNCISSLQRSLDKESCQSQDLAAENNRLMQAQVELMSRGNLSSVSVAVGKPLTEELFEVESDGGCDVSMIPGTVTATLDDFQEISLPSTPTVMEGCTDVFEEHFKVLESLESYLESQHLIGAVSEDESGISTSPSIHENEPVALLEAQLSQLRTEKHFLLNSVVHSQKKDEIIQILINQLKYNAPRQYLVETAAHIRKIAENGDSRDRDIDAVCRLLEAPIDLTVTAEICSPVPQQPPASCNSNDYITPPHKVVRQNTVTVLPDEDPLLCPASDLRITRKVGHDGLVIAWLPSPDPECTGYLICVNDQEAQRVRNAARTKAVLCGLDLHNEMEICIYSMSVDGLISSPDSALYRPDEHLAAAGDTESEPSSNHSSNVQQNIGETVSPREVVVQTFYTNSSVTVRSSRRVTGATSGPGSRIPVRSSVP